MKSLFAKHRTAALLFSAGKDSLATLLLLKPYWEQLEVIWVNPGAPYDEVVEYTAKIRALVPYTSTRIFVQAPDSKST